MQSSGNKRYRFTGGVVKKYVRGNIERVKKKL